MRLDREGDEGRGKRGEERRQREEGPIRREEGRGDTREEAHYCFLLLHLSVTPERKGAREDTFPICIYFSSRKKEEATASPIQVFLIFHGLRKVKLSSDIFQ